MAVVHGLPARLTCTAVVLWFTPPPPLASPLASSTTQRSEYLLRYA